MMKNIIIDEKGNIKYHKSGDFHSMFGVVRENEIKPGIVKSNKGHDFIIFNAHFSDELRNIERGPAVTHIKDIGYIISFTGIGVGSKILDAGSGSGHMASALARVGCEVISYEKKKEFFDIASNNIKKLNLNVNIKNKDIYNGIEEKDFDLINLDLLEPWKVLPYVKSALKSGGYLVCYLPNITQIMELVNLMDNSFYLWSVVEVLVREWSVQNLKVRPNNHMLGHTAFLIFIRKI